MTVCEIDFRVGGAWRYVLRTSDGREVKFSGVYREIVPFEKIVATERFEEPRMGNPEYQTTLTLEEFNGKTKMTNRVLHPSTESRDAQLNSGMERGAADAFDQLEELLATERERMEREIEITRIFDAPRELVFDAWTDPEHMVQWWGPSVFTNHSCELDVRPGGAWQIVMRSPDGTDFRCQGVYSEVVKPERLIFTNDAVDQNGQPLLKGFTTVKFADQGGKTRLTLQTRAIGLVDLAPQMLRGMEQGWSQSLDKLAGHLAG
jgi:uncharacterized protein YndB with AHSA1/START domain